MYTKEKHHESEHEKVLAVSERSFDSHEEACADVERFRRESQEASVEGS